jgi:hypothetical protein
VNKYAAMAESHWKRWLPNRYARVGDPSNFFSTLGMEASNQIAALALDLLGSESPGEDFLTRVGRRNMARLQAEEMVLRELILLPPEDSASEDDDSDLLPVEWSIPSAQEMVATVAAGKGETP